MRARALGLALLVLVAAAATGLATGSPPAKDVELRLLGTYATGVYDEGAAEIAAYDGGTRRIFVTNGADNTIDILDAGDPARPAKTGAIDISALGAGANSVATHGGIVAVAIEADPSTEPGTVALYDTGGRLLAALEVGAQPDMLTFTPNGRYLLVANEGEPSDDYSSDPEGSVSVIDLRRGAARVGQADVRTAGFGGYSRADLAPGVRVFGPAGTVAQNLEPEYVAVSGDGRTAWVSLQEANALAVVDVAAAQVTQIRALGVKDHSLPANALDPSNRDGAIRIGTWPVQGMYQPDGIATVSYRGETYVLSANEGDSRDYDAYSEESRVKDLILDPAAFPDAVTLQRNENLGRLKVTTADGDTDGDGDYDELYSFGARSFSVWSADGEQVFDSGSELERITAERFPEDFNSHNDENGSFDSRSDDKGPEPEGITVGAVEGRTYAFLGLERIGGVMVYEVTNPRAPVFVDYLNPRDFGGDAASGTAGDLGPEGLEFVPASQSPTGAPLLIVTNEVSGTTSLLQIDRIG